jgi:cephalosporin hydroxylase/glycosyltransferase involved in cell wall biosynthesis
VVEIGALRGETTELLLDALPRDAQLHVIDPLPQFDPSEHERRFGGRYVFHRDTSHAVLRDLEAVDVAIVDGDHNWFTVYRELDLLRQAARAAGSPLPALILHDVLWPYGRRDLYYEPARIPEEFRQPHERRGMKPGQAELLPPDEGGINPTLHNATTEGGARNGVMTAIDDFVAEHDQPVRRVVLPIYFGLAIVADEERLAETPALVPALDRLEAGETRLELLELAESLRLRSVLAEHNAVYGGVARAVRGANRYLGVLKGAILNQQGLENELRLEYLTWCANTGQEPDPVWMRHPVSKLREKFERLQVSRVAGTTPRDAIGVPYYPWTAMGRTRLDHLERCLDSVRDEGIPGDFVDCGVGRGGGAIFMRGFLEAHEVPVTQVWAVDRFLGPETAGALAVESNQLADLNMVREGFDRFDLLDERVRFLQGEPAETLESAPVEQIALARVDCTQVERPIDALAALYARVAPGGFVLAHGLEAAGAREGLEAFREAHGLTEPVERIDGSALVWRKAGESTGVATKSESDQGGPAKDLSVVVVFYEMRREAERTLQSLSRSFQRGVEDLDYEVIVIENGSSPEQRLEAEFVASFGKEFRLVDLGESATPSPAQALNRGIEASDGRVVALMIDGAHVLSPGVLHYGMLGIRAHSPAMVAVQQWYVGPGQQAEAIAEGYDQEFEDGLFKRIEWPSDGYRLFEISHFIGYRDWLDGMWESNCIFVEREILDQIGLVEEAFDMPGGGFANLDLYERIGSTPGLSLVTILGEGSFHQVHGGTTTNAIDPEERERALAAYREHYSELRGKSYKGPDKPFHYVGSVRDSAKRTRTRRMGAQAFFGTGAVPESDLMPTSPAPLPEELVRQFTEAYWRSFRWRDTSWLGRSVERSPADLLAYAQLVAEIEPDWIIETAPGDGRGFFLATICELLGRGEVISLGDTGNAPAHPRLRSIAGDPLSEEVSIGVHESVGQPPNAMLVFGLSDQDDLMAKFNAYSPLVPVGSVAVFEDTIMNGYPIWPGMGPGPSEAVRRINELHPEWVADPTLERLAPTFNPGGYLRRTG